MVVYPCEPRGGAWQKYSPFFRGFCVWLYRDFVKSRIFGWEYAFPILGAVFPEESQPDEATIVGWYRDNPNYPEKLHLVGSPSPAEYFQEWCVSHPNETKKFAALAFLKTKTESWSRGLQPQQYSGQSSRTVAPIHFPKRQPSPQWTFDPAYAQQPMNVMTWFGGPRYRLEHQPSTFNNNLIEQLLGVMCQALFLAMAGWFARQCVKIAVS
jgi:hypothetical protein